MAGLEELEPCRGIFLHLRRLDAVSVTPHAHEQRDDDVLHLHGHVLVLLQQLVETHSTVKLSLGGGIEIGTELGEGSDLTVLGELQLHGTSHLLHSLDLRGRPHTGHGQTHVNGGTLALIEQLRGQENLSVGNRNHISRDVGRHITSLGLNNGQGGEGAVARRVAHLGRSLEETGVQVEHVTGVGLTARGTTQKERHLAVSHGLLGEIVVEDHGVLAVVSEVLTHGTSRVRG